MVDVMNPHKVELGIYESRKTSRFGHSRKLH